MADPVSWLAIGSAVFGAAGAISSANANSANQKAAADAANYNATVDAQKADTVLQQSSVTQEQQRRKSAIYLGSQRAAVGESGIGLSEGSGFDITQQSAINSELDALNIQYEGNLNSRSMKQQGTLDVAAANNANANASSIKQAGYVSAGASILSGVGGYMQGQNTKRYQDALVKNAQRGLV